MLSVLDMGKLELDFYGGLRLWAVAGLNWSKLGLNRGYCVLG